MRTTLLFTAALLFAAAAQAADGGADTDTDADAGADTETGTGSETDTGTDADADTDADTDPIPCLILCTSEEECLAAGGSVLAEHPCWNPEEVCCQADTADTENDDDGFEGPMCEIGEVGPCGCDPVGRARGGSLLALLL